MKFHILLLLFLLPGYLLHAQPQQAMEKLLAADGLRHAAIGISVKRVKDSKTIASHSPQMSLTPASVIKLLPTYFALKEKGENYTYQTSVYYTGSMQEGILNGNLIIAAAGDPCFDSRYFPEYKLVKILADTLHAMGVKTINGKIIIENTRKETPIPGSWLWEDISNYYGAVYQPFNYRDNTCILTFRSGKAGTKTQLTSVFPFQPGTEYLNEVIASVENRDNAWVFGGPYSNRLYIKGSIPQNRSAFQVKGAIHYPAATFIAELTESLKQYNIIIQNRDITDNKKSVLKAFVSPHLIEIATHTNKTSVNLFAEALGHLATEGDFTAKIGSLLHKIQIDTVGLILKDACGLSVMNAIPAEVLTDLLVHASKNNNSAFIATLPVAGTDRGLNNYCAGEPILKNNLKAKTGSMSGVRCLSGYITTQKGEQLAFTILINHYICSPAQLQQYIKEFLVALVKH